MTEELERFEGKLKLLNDKVAFSTISVSFEPRGSTLQTQRVKLPVRLALVAQAPQPPSAQRGQMKSESNEVRPPTGVVGGLPKVMRALWTLMALGALLLAGCGRPFDIKTAPGFVPLANQAGYSYDYRATTPEGVVVAVRVIDDENRGDIAFWTEALTLQLRDINGYALLSTEDVATRDGTKGKLLKFGHDEDNKPFAYWVGAFLAQGRLFIVEAGGQKDAFERAKPGVEWMLASVKVKCDTIVSPVLASRTCNKW